MAFKIRIRGAKRVDALVKQLDVVNRTNFSVETIDEGYKLAKSIVPRDTGALSQGIQKVLNKQSGRVRLVQPNDGRGRPYHMWFHGIKAPSPSGKNGAGRGYDLRTGKFAPTSGRTNFMEEVYDLMNNKTLINAEEKIDRILR